MSASRDGREPLTSVRDRIQAGVVGRGRELGLVLAAVAAGRDILLEGPPGTSKSTLLRAITAAWGIPLVFVEGNADLTPAKLIGHHNPARVLREDYSPENFVDGPLIEAMRGGGFLYIEEFNRAPEDTLNTLLTAMAERRIAVPRVGEVVARDTFRVIASMNPYDNIGTTRLSTSVHDRLCRLAITYQDAAAERGIVALRAPLPDLKPARYERLVADAVAVTRATRAHEDIRQGSSVRGAIDLTLVAGQLFNLDPERVLVFSGPAHDSEGRATVEAGRVDPAAAGPDKGGPGTVGQGTGESAAAGPGASGSAAAGPDTGEPGTDVEQSYREIVYDAMVVALSGRIFLDEIVEATPEQVLRQIWEDHFLLQHSILDPAAASPG
jgi:MoxR-like ATPase